MRTNLFLVMEPGLQGNRRTTLLYRPLASKKLVASFSLKLEMNEETQAKRARKKTPVDRITKLLSAKGGIIPAILFVAFALGAVLLSASVIISNIAPASGQHAPQRSLPFHFISHRV
jgi:hypothetical protein